MQNSPSDLDEIYSRLEKIYPKSSRTKILKASFFVYLNERGWDMKKSNKYIIEIFEKNPEITKEEFVEILLEEKSKIEEKKSIFAIKRIILTPFNYYFLGFKNYFNYKGRSTRSEYWWFIFIGYIIFLILLDVLVKTITNTEFVTNILIGYVLLHIVPFLLLKIRRLHDVGKSGKMLIIPLIILPLTFFNIITDPLIIKGLEGFISLYFLVLFITPSENKENKYGEPLNNKIHRTGKNLISCSKLHDYIQKKITWMKKKLKLNKKIKKREGVFSKNIQKKFLNLKFLFISSVVYRVFLKKFNSFLVCLRSIFIKIKNWKFTPLLLMGIILIIFLFYWNEIRPSIIRKECSVQSLEETFHVVVFDSLSKDDYDLKIATKLRNKETFSEVEKKSTTYEKYLKIKSTKTMVLSDKRFNIAYKNSYNYCLQSKGL